MFDVRGSVRACGLLAAASKRSRSDESTLALYPLQQKLPHGALKSLKSNRERMIDVDVARINIDRTLGLPLMQSLLAKAGAERNDVDRAKILSATRDREIHRAETSVVLQPVKRDVPEIRLPVSGASSDCVNRAMIAFLEIAKGAIRIWSEQANDTLVEGNCPHDQTLWLEPDRYVILPERPISCRYAQCRSAVLDRHNSTLSRL